MAIGVLAAGGQAAIIAKRLVGTARQRAPDLECGGCPHAGVLKARGGAYSVLIALGSARQRYSSLLAQRRVTRRKGTPGLVGATRRLPVLLDRKRACCGTPRCAGQTVPRCSVFCLRCSAAPRGQGAPQPRWTQPSIAGPTGRSEDCLSDQRSRVPQRRSGPSSAGEPSPPARASLRGLFFSFLLGKKK